ncbi:DUF6348 family protein [Nonomuraea sp. NPDC050536]|uniref:DUF6348 family protein n=1 Tax=Nonomuraea sp. NPDC050536 TaxID=3364366 RepID=UPI0037CAF62E
MARAARLSDDQILTLIAEHLTNLQGYPWQVRDGLVKGPANTGILLANEHSGSEEHFDFHFVANLDHPKETTIPDCVSGYGGSAESQAESAIHIWASTTGWALLELMTQDESFTTHLQPDDPDGFPGWHLIHGGILGWGTGDHSSAAQNWLMNTKLARALGDIMPGPFDRDELVGIKVIFGGNTASPIAEVRVNGIVDGPASQAVLNMPWPRHPTDLSYARTFLLLIHRGDH